MKTPKIKFRKDVLEEIQAIKSKLKTKELIKQDIKSSIQFAEEITAKGLDALEQVFDTDSEEEILNRWNALKFGSLYFGESCKIRHIKKIKRRIKLIHRRLSKRKLTIRVRPQHKAPTKTTAGQNLGSIFSPVSYTHLRAHETKANLVCRLLLEKKK